MKALELTVYPFDRSFPAGYVLPRHTRITLIAADRMARSKRLTDAELAAEWQQSQRHMAVAVICAQPQATVEIRRTETLHRFATLPHYDDPTNQKAEGL